MLGGRGFMPAGFQAAPCSRRLPLPASSGPVSPVVLATAPRVLPSALPFRHFPVHLDQPPCTFRLFIGCAGAFRHGAPGGVLRFQVCNLYRTLSLSSLMTVRVFTRSWHAGRAVRFSCRHPHFPMVRRRRYRLPARLLCPSAHGSDLRPFGCVRVQAGLVRSGPVRAGGPSGGAHRISWWSGCYSGRTLQTAALPPGPRFVPTWYELARGSGVCAACGGSDSGPFGLLPTPCRPALALGRGRETQ